MKVIIDRTNWLRGEGPSDSYLLRSRDSKMCCLGFVAVSAGATREAITDRETPADSDVEACLTGLVAEDGDLDINTMVCDRMMTINDDSLLSDAEREQRLIEEASSIGYELEFVGASNA